MSAGKGRCSLVLEGQACSTIEWELTICGAKSANESVFAGLDG